MGRDESGEQSVKIKSDLLQKLAMVGISALLGAGGAYVGGGGSIETKVALFEVRISNLESRADRLEGSAEKQATFREEIRIELNSIKGVLKTLCLRGAKNPAECER